MTLDELAEQALSRILAAHHRCVKWYHDATQWSEDSWEIGVSVDDLWQRELRAALHTLAEGATQAQREQLEQAQAGNVKLQKHRDDWRGYAYGKREKPEDFLDGNMVERGLTRIEQLEQQLAQVTQERDALQRQLRSYKAALS